MSTSSSENSGKSGKKKVRVSFRRNRAKRVRQSDWTQQAGDTEDNEIDADRDERVAAKGALSRRRTIMVDDADLQAVAALPLGTVVTMRGLYADVDDGRQILTCTVRRILRTRLIKDRHPVTVGDRVRFRAEPETEGVEKEGVIEAVEQRRGELKRRSGKRIHTIVANVDQAVVVSSADQPPPKPHLIDRYLVAAHAGEITPLICMNKIDLDPSGEAAAMLERYAKLGYATLGVSAVTGDGVDALRDALAGKESVIAGQSGVGKSSMLNAVQPGLRLATGDVIEHLGKGRHTTTTSCLLRLDVGGYVVDTPGVRSFDLSTIGREEFEALFIEFIEHVENCKFPDCTHTHEIQCAVKAAVETGAIHPERYESYVRLFEEPTDPDWENRFEE